MLLLLIIFTKGLYDIETFKKCGDVLKVVRILAILSVVLLLLSACGKNSIPGAKSYPIESFTYTDQEGDPFSLEDLKGKVWVADFIFTNCADVCLPMTANMSKLQDKVKEKGIKDVEFVSFSVDPAIDTPDILKDFALKFRADFSNWHFLTGYSQEHIEEFAKNSFKTPVKKPDNSDQVIHGIDFFLVNQKGEMVKYYEGTENIPMDEIIKHIQILQEK